MIVPAAIARPEDVISTVRALFHGHSYSPGLCGISGTFLFAQVVPWSVNMPKPPSTNSDVGFVNRSVARMDGPSDGENETTTRTKFLFFNTLLVVNMKMKFRVTNQTLFLRSGDKIDLLTDGI